MTSTACPTDPELASFAIGDLPEPILAQIAHHVETCENCDRRIGSLTHPDEFVSWVRIAASSPATPTENLSNHLVAVAIQAADQGTCDPTAIQCPGTLGNFELLEEVGRGSFGAVFRARDVTLDRIVAVKILHRGQLATRPSIERFLREAHNAAQLTHPNIVTLYESARTDSGLCYIVEEFIDGETLQCFLDSNPHGLPPEQSALIVADLADALAYAHRRGIVHRDVKPSNILLDSARHPHLVDFGLATREDDSRVTVDGEVVGTPGYMSPEQARGDEHVTASSDMYSLGVVLYELLVGERPFRGVGRMLLAQVIDDEPTQPRRLNDRIPRDLEVICLKALEKLPARRYEFADAMRDDLRRFLAGDAILARPAQPLERCRRWCRRHPLQTAMLLSAVFGSALGFWHLTALSQRLVERSAIDSAGMQAEMLEKVNALYSELIIKRLMQQGLEVSARYADDPNAFPVPASFLTGLGHSISESSTGMRVRHYSDYPFKSRTDGGPRDEFEQEALHELRLHPGRPYYKFTSDDEGHPVLRYAAARRMETSCVACHNSHPDSTKRDWKTGDVRGVLEIVRPLKSDRDRISEGLRGTFLLVATTAGLLLIGCAAVLLVRRNRVTGQFEKTGRPAGR
jgi:eukaryotic-like serine/threonine-protein kinase